MENTFHRHAASIILAIGLAGCCTSKAADLSAAQITSTLKRSADWQFANPSDIEIRVWIIAPLYDALPRTSLATDEPKYLAA